MAADALRDGAPLRGRGWASGALSRAVSNLDTTRFLIPENWKRQGGAFPLSGGRSGKSAVQVPPRALFAPSGGRSKKSTVQVPPRAFLPNGGRSKSPRFKSPRGRFFQTAAARKVHGSSLPAGVSSKRRPLEKPTVQVPPLVFFQAAAARKVHGSTSSRGRFFPSGRRSKSPWFRPFAAIFPCGGSMKDQRLRFAASLGGPARSSR